MFLECTHIVFQTISLSSAIQSIVIKFQFHVHIIRAFRPNCNPFCREKQEKYKNARFIYHDSSLSRIEACFAVGDRRLSKVLYRAWQSGCILDGWDECFLYDNWLQAFVDCGLDLDFYAHRQRSLDETLPWDHIDAYISKSFLKREYEKALRAETTRDCRQGCNGCGLQVLKGVCRGCE